MAHTPRVQGTTATRTANDLTVLAPVRHKRSVKRVVRLTRAEAIRGLARDYWPPDMHHWDGEVDITVVFRRPAR